MAKPLPIHLKPFSKVGMSEPIRILHLEDDTIDAQLIHAKLESDKLSCDIVRAQDRQSFEAAVMQTSFDLIMS